MFKADVGEMITDMIDSIFPEFSPPTEGVLVVVGFNVSEPYDLKKVKNGESRTVSYCVKFLFRRASNFTNVWSAVCDNVYDTPSLEEWENVSNHDSCWKDAIHSNLSTLYFKMCARVNSKVAPKVLETHIFFFKIKKVEIFGCKPDPNCIQNYKRVFESVKVVKT